MKKVSWSRLMFVTMLSFVLALAACGNDSTSNEESTDGSEATTEEAADDTETASEDSEESAEDSEEATDDSEAATEESAESEPKVTEFEPAFPEQTRAPAVETETELDVEVVAEGLGVSWGMEEFDTNRILVTQNFLL